MTQFDIFWTPTKNVETRCRRCGMKDGDGTSYWDWIEPDDCTVSVTRKSFVAAVRVARRAIPFDVFGEVVIRRVVMVQRSFGKKDREHDAVWNVYVDGPRPDEKSPDYINDIELCDGDLLLR